MARPIPTVTPPDPPWSIDRLGARIETMLQRAAILVLNAIKDAISNIFSVGIEITIEEIEQAAAPRLAPIIDEILKTPDLPAWVATYLDHIKNPTAQADVFGIGASSQAVASNVQNGLLAPVSRLINYMIDSGLSTARPDPGTSFAAFWRGMHSRENMELGLKQLGWDDEFIPALEAIVRPRLSLGDLWAYRWRYTGSSEFVKDEARALGYTEPDIEKMEVLAHQYPNPADLVRMAVREVFDPAQAEALSLFAEFPTEFRDEMYRAGFDFEWSQRYWGAHWELPSLQMGFEMFHRGEITYNQLNSLIKAHDIAPVWRDKLLAISYSVPTRVDVRRAYKEGNVTLAQVKRVYQDLGYNDEWAQILTDWTAVAYEPEEQEATKAEILAALQRGTLTESEARQSLEALNYGADMIEFYLAQVRYKKAQAVKKLKVDAIQDLYETGQIDQAEARTRLTALALPSNEIDADIELWTITRQRKTKRPTATQAKKFYVSDLISSDEYRQMLDVAGYGDEYIALYVRAADAEKAANAAEEAERAQKEQERLDKAEKVTEYQRAVAEIDVQTAQERQTIASAQSALNATMSASEIADARIQIEQLDAQIAAEQAAARVVHAQRTDAQNALRAKISDVDRQALEATIDEARQEIADISAEIAGLNVDIEERQLAQLKAGISDTQRETLEAKINSAREEIARINSEIAKANVGIEQRELALLQAPVTDTKREELEATIDAAREEIARINDEIALVNVKIEQWELDELQEDDPVRLAELAEEIQVFKVEIAELREQSEQQDIIIAEARTQLGEAEPEAIEKLDVEIQKYRVQIAELREQSEQRDIAIVEANAQLRAYITDSERQALEEQIRTADATIARHDVEVADYRRQQAVLQARIVAALNDDQRAQLKAAIDAARERVAGLQVARAQARVTEVA